jgi:hypothetical protein
MTRRAMSRLSSAPTLLAVLMLACLPGCQTTDPRQSVRSDYTSIRQVDFRNYDFPIRKDDSGVFPEAQARIRGGEYESMPGVEPWRAASVEQPLYGDATNDGVEDALVPLTLQWIGANPANSYEQLFYFYEIENGRAVVKQIVDRLLLLRSYDTVGNTEGECDGWLWNAEPISIGNGAIHFRLHVGGRHCVDNGYVADVVFRRNGDRFVLEEPIKRSRVSGAVQRFCCD